MSNPVDALNFLKLCECTVRGLPIGDKGDESRRQYTESHNKICRDMAYMTKKASSSAWPAEFTNKICRAMSIKSIDIDEATKKLIRNGEYCMACGKSEHRNYKAISIFGCCSAISVKRSKLPFHDMECLEDDYTKYVSAYNTVFKDAEDVGADRDAMYRTALHPQDGGIIVVGETCHARVMLTFMCSSFMFEFMYDADHHIREAKQTYGMVSPHRLYSCEKSDVLHLIDSYQKMSTLVTNETDEIVQAQIATDYRYLQMVNTIRSNTPYKTLGETGNKAWVFDDDQISDDESDEQDACSNSSYEDDSRYVLERPLRKPRLSRHPRHKSIMTESDVSADEAASLHDEPINPSKKSRLGMPHSFTKPNCDAIDKLKIVQSNLVTNGNFEDAMLVLQAIMALEK